MFVVFFCGVCWCSVDVGVIGGLLVVVVVV